MIIDGCITFFYYNNLEEASNFYQKIMGFKKVLDVDFAQLYKIFDNVYVGLVDGERGSIKPSEKKSVMLSIFVDDVDAWYEKLKEKGLEINPPEEPGYLKMKVLIFKDTEDYAIELLQWQEKPF